VNGMVRLYGGQVVAQALAAAERTVAANRATHSCHGYFVRPGDPAIPVDYAVTRDRDGRSFSARRVTATQLGEPIFTLAASMHIVEPGAAHQASMPQVRAPETLVDDAIAIRTLSDRLPAQHVGYWRNANPFDFRIVEQVDPVQPVAVVPSRHVWFRAKSTLGDDAALHRQLFAWASDLYLLHTGLMPLGIGWTNERLQTASLDHSIWFHAPFRVDDWLLCVMDSPVAGAARTLARATVFKRSGQLVASVAQEGLIRLPPD
jgi:acyl-CoA thioesterase-2